ncbi:hypothetical protein BURMUCGD1_5291 [Burkholderia multivorans CGD1]|nr:hypothetical protein BURMUCGD1_5291 [Burkholderia multivorans CGD1]
MIGDDCAPYIGDGARAHVGRGTHVRHIIASRKYAENPCVPRVRAVSRLFSHAAWCD